MKKSQYIYTTNNLKKEKTIMKSILFGTVMLMAVGLCGCGTTSQSYSPNKTGNSGGQFTNEEIEAMAQEAWDSMSPEEQADMSKKFKDAGLLKYAE